MKKLLLSIFFIITFIKLSLSITLLSPTIVFDESIYSIAIRSIWENHTYFTGRFLNYPQYPPLYPLLLSPVATYIYSESFFRYAIAINCIITSSTIFPSYYLTKEYLSDRESHLVAFLVGIMPSTFIYSFIMMADCLFLPLFLTSVYFMKKTLDEDNFKNNFLSGVFISLTFLTKVIAVILVLVYIIIKLWHFVDKKIED